MVKRAYRGKETEGERLGEKERERERVRAREGEIMVGRSK